MYTGGMKLRRLRNTDKTILRLVDGSRGVTIDQLVGVMWPNTRQREKKLNTVNRYLDELTGMGMVVPIPHKSGEVWVRGLNFPAESPRPESAGLRLAT